jgi:nitrilase
MFTDFMLPLRFDIEDGVTKTCSLIAEAGQNDAQLVAFPELWIPGYPNFVHAHDPKAASKYLLQYYHNSVEVDSTYMHRIRCATRDARITAVLAYSERDGGSLYMSQTFIGPDGNVLLHRRKLKPTGYERTVFGDAVSRINFSLRGDYGWLTL